MSCRMQGMFIRPSVHLSNFSLIILDQWDWDKGLGPWDLGHEVCARGSGPEGLGQKPGGQTR